MEAEYPHQQAAPSYSTTATVFWPYATRRRKRAEDGSDLSLASDMDLDADAQRAAVRTRSRFLPVSRYLVALVARLRVDWIVVAAGWMERTLALVSVGAWCRAQFLGQGSWGISVRAGLRARLGGFVLCSGYWLVWR